MSGGSPNPEGELNSVRASVTELRESCWRKRMMLWNGAARRQRWQRALHLVSGIVTLVSGGSVAALLATISGAEGLKLIGAIIAFLSGVLSLIVTTYFDVKETQKMFEGASAYGVLRDRLINLNDGLSSLAIKTAVERLAKIREDAGKSAHQYDQLLPTGGQLAKSLQALNAFRIAFPNFGGSFFPH
jgi:hypothetical protein